MKATDKTLGHDALPRSFITNAVFRLVRPWLKFKDIVCGACYDYYGWTPLGEEYLTHAN